MKNLIVVFQLPGWFFYYYLKADKFSFDFESWVLASTKGINSWGLPLAAVQP